MLYTKDLGFETEMGCAATSVAPDSRPDSAAYGRYFAWQDDVRVVLLGKSGVGKSESGCGIIGRRRAFEFQPSFCPVTRICQREHKERFGANIYVTDTPGIVTSKSEESDSKEILKCVDMNAPGPNVFLYVLRADVRFTSEDVDALKAVKDMFGKEIFRHMIIVFTRGNQLKNSDHSVDEKLEEMPKEFQELYQNCHGRYITIENPGPQLDWFEYERMDKERQKDIRSLFESIYELLHENSWSCYSSQKGNTMKMEE